MNTIINKVSALKVSPTDKHSAGIDVLTTDIREILDTISVQRSTLDQGTRQSFIFELDSLMSRLNIYRSDGASVDASFRKELFEMKGLLMKAQAEVNARLEENKKKLESQQASSAAPKLVLMKLRGYVDWISWYLCLIEITKFITPD